jgi:hypothetical protein
MRIGLQIMYRDGNRLFPSFLAPCFPGQRCSRLFIWMQKGQPSRVLGHNTSFQLFSPKSQGHRFGNEGASKAIVPERAGTTVASWHPIILQPSESEICTRLSSEASSHPLGHIGLTPTTIPFQITLFMLFPTRLLSDTSSYRCPAWISYDSLNILTLYHSLLLTLIPHHQTLTTPAAHGM